jgi:hypothetical protein
MKTLGLAVAVVALLTACAAPTTSTTAAPPPDTYTGEVWTWDEPNNIVTLRRGTQDVRVKISPDQMKQLELHRVMTVRGQLAGPAEIERVVTPTGPTVAVAKGPVEQAEINGRVVSVDPKGLITIDSARGPLQVWVTAPDAAKFPVGSDVRVRVAVQSVDYVAASGSSTPASLDPAASPSSEPGDYAVVIGSILKVDPSGAMTVESPRGPVTVWVPQGSSRRVGDSVQVRTSVHPGR